MSRASFEKQGRRSQAARAKGRVTLTLDDVVRAGAELLDTKGVEGLSMRALATHLGTGSGTLYWHVHNKEQLLRRILDETLRTVTPPDDGPWHERLTDILTQTRSVLLKRPALVQVLWDAQWDLGPHTLKLADTTIKLVAASGMPEQKVADAYFALITYVFGFVVAETAAVGAPPFGASHIDDEQALTREQAEHVYPHLLQYAPSADAAGMHRRFTIGLTSLISGIAPHQ